MTGAEKTRSARRNKRAATAWGYHAAARETVVHQIATQAVFADHSAANHQLTTQAAQMDRKEWQHATVYLNWSRRLQGSKNRNKAGGSCDRSGWRLRYLQEI